MALPEVTIHANLEGVEQVNAGFQQMGQQVDLFGNKVKDSTNQMDVSYRRLALTTAAVIANSIQLGDIMARMASGQMDVGRGALMLAMNFLQLVSQIVTLADAMKGLGIAAAITHAISSLGLSLPLIAAAAATAAVIAVGAYAISSKQLGGPIYQTGPYLLHAGEYVVPRGGSPITVNIYDAGSPQATGDAVVDALRRAGAI